jgi:RNA polymerase sigma factor (TIGR02999 family)
LDPERPSAITRLLHDLGRGEPGAFDALLPLVYEELRILANRHLHQERAGHTLSPTALVHEIYLELAGDANLSWENRAHFFGIAARAMRQVLVSHARRRDAAKRGGGWERVTLSPDLAPDGTPGPSHEVEILDIHHALEKLGAIDERAGRVVELRFFGGLTLDEIAFLLGVSRRTVADDWAVARAVLARELVWESGE